MGKIYEHDNLYSFLRPYVDWCIQHSYRETTICGEENLPKDGAVIIAPNHCNTLMDALVVLRARKGATVFGARADLFKKFAKPLTFFRILPMVRKRDGLREVEKNRETNEKIVEVLEHDTPFCIFSEGTHRPKRSLLPITKGVIRIALSANEKFGGRKPVYIVPAGIEYGDYFRYRSTSLLQYGEPINVTEFVSSHPEMTEGEIYIALRAMIAEGISKLITYVKDDESYDAKWTLAKIMASDRSGSLKKKLEQNRQAIAKIEAIAQDDPERMADLSQKAALFDQLRHAAGISILSFTKTPLWFNLLWKSIVAIAGFPLALFYLVTCAPFWLFSETVRRKVKDRAFHNTVHFAAKVIFTPIVALLWAAVFFTTLPHAIAFSGLGFICPALRWIIPTALTLSTIWGQGYLYDYLEFLRVYNSDCRLTCHRSISRMYKEIRKELK